MNAKQLWVASYRFKRAMSGIRSEGRDNQVMNGLYPSWMPKEQYRTFLWYCNLANMVRLNRLATDPLDTQDKRQQAARVKSLLDDMSWDEQVDLAYVRRKVGEGLRDLYHVW